METVDKQFLWQVFQQVDLNKSGFIDASELQQCLMSGSFEFQLMTETCQLMVNMFDMEKKGKISFQDFGSVWKNLTQWQECFRKFDRDETGTINNYKLLTALQTLGFKLPLKTVDTITKRFQKETEDQDSIGIYFDDFVHCCLVLHNITRGFRKLDPKNAGEIKIKYEDFVELVFEAGL